jgi:Family of unknown function (DUF5994)
VISAIRGQDGSVAMTLEQARSSLRWERTRVARTPRFRLKRTAHDGGYVDGAWWPRTDDLIAELPDLIAVLSVHQGAIRRVMYNLNEWRITPTEIVIGGRAVQLDGCRGHLPNTVEVLAAKGNTIILLVVPFHIDPDRAHAMVMTAAAPGNVSTVDTLLMISVKDRESRTNRDAARERWGSQDRANTIEESGSTLHGSASHAVVELEAQLIELKKHQVQAK